MENTLLFINQNQDVIQEFLKAMEGKKGPMEIDTADSGLEAAFLLKKKKYKVVVTGLNLPTYDGTKIIEYLNQNYPETVCIVYTWRLEQAHLKLLINERKVFRIFQRPASYLQIYEAILDGFVRYDKKEADALDRRDLEQELKKAAHTLKELREISKDRPWEKEEMIKFLRSLLNVFVHDIESAMPGKEKWQLIRYEKKVLFWLLEQEGNAMESLGDVQRSIYKWFLHPESDQQVEITINSQPGTLEKEFCEKLHFIIWLLLTRFVMISSAYGARVVLIPINKERFRVRVEGVFPEGVWVAAHEDMTTRIMTGVTQDILECFADRFTQSISDERVVYYMEVHSTKWVE
ncbi:MAG: response regulator [Lachnospiraceae bacterium]|nr:response regulator [Lachnospiraceae bacterium]